MDGPVWFRMDAVETDVEERFDLPNYNGIILTTTGAVACLYLFSPWESTVDDSRPMSASQGGCQRVDADLAWSR